MAATVISPTVPFMRIKSRLLLVLLACAGSVPAESAIDFTPRYADMMEDGIPFHRMYFTEGDNRIFFRPPANWQVSGDTAAIYFTPKGLHVSQVSFRSVPPEEATIPFDEKGIEKLREIAKSLLPSAFTDPEEQFETVNPIILQDWTSFEIAFSGHYYGIDSRRSILFINLAPGRQLRIVVEAPIRDFEKLHKDAYRSLATWREVGP
jgi:hypothetical protein